MTEELPWPDEFRRSDVVGNRRVPVRTSDVWAVAAVAAIVLVLALISVPVALAASGAIVVAVVLGVYRSLRRHADRDYRQVESLFSLFSVARLDAALPPMRTWAASPDFALLVASCLLDKSPERVLECGSGVTTVIAGSVLRRLGSGTVLSLEHDPRYARRTERLVRRHGLEDIVRVVLAPLESHELERGAETWYGTDWLSPDDIFDVVIVDGPPVPPASRYPLLPLLGSHLRDGAVLVVDDAAREAARRDLQRWSKDVPDLGVQSVRAEKGAALVRWPASGESGRESGVDDGAGRRAP